VGEREGEAWSEVGGWGGGGVALHIVGTQELEAGLRAELVDGIMDKVTDGGPGGGEQAELQVHLHDWADGWDAEEDGLVVGGEGD